MAGAVALSCSLIVAVSCAIATAQASLEHGIQKYIGATDARIIHPANGRFDETVLDTVRSWPEVALAVGRLKTSLTLVHADGRSDLETGWPLRVTPDAYAVDLESEHKFRTFELAKGRMPGAPGEILIDPMTSEQLQADVGDVLSTRRGETNISFTVSGIYKRLSLGMLQRPRVYMDRRALAEAAGREGELTGISIILTEESSIDEFCALHQSDVPNQLALEPAEMVRTGFDNRVSASKIGLTIASMLTFMSAGFIIVTGLTTGITEQQRQMALLRCIGAERSQLFVSQLLVGIFFGVLGALMGIPLGLALAEALVLYYRDYLPTGLTLSWLGLSLAAAGSVGAGLLGAVYPAVYAARVAPLQVMTQQARPLRPRSIVICTIAAIACIGIQLILLVPGDDETRFWAYAYVGLPVVFIGFFLLSVPMLFLVTVLLARPLSGVLALPRDMLAGSVLATPFRHGFTAGALMVGLSILVDGWACGVSLMDDWIAHIQFADGFAFRMTGIPEDQQRAIAALPFVEDVCPIGYLPVQIVDRQVFGLTGLSPRNVVCLGFNPRRFFRMNAVDWSQGDPEYAIEQLESGDGIIVADRFVTAKNIGVGERLTLASGRVKKEFEIVGVVSSAGLDISTQIFGIQSAYTDFAISCVFMDARTVSEVFDNRDTYLLQIDLANEITDEDAEKQVTEAAPGTVFRSGRWIMDTITEIATASMAVQSTVAIAAVVLAAMAMGNVMAANIHGRRYEYGVLLAVGAHRRMVMRLILGEAMLLAITASVIGTIFGFHLAWIDVRHLRDLAGLPVTVGIPVTPIAIGWGIVLFMAMLASLPGAIGLLRRDPCRLVSAGRND